MKFKKIIASVLTLAMIAGLLPSAVMADEAVAGEDVKAKEYYLAAGEIVDLAVDEDVLFDTEDAYWSSSDEKIVFVRKGVVTGISEGEAVVSAAAGDGSRFDRKYVIGKTLYIKEGEKTKLCPDTNVLFDEEQTLYLLEDGDYATVDIEEIDEDAAEYTEEEGVFEEAAENGEEALEEADEEAAAEDGDTSAEEEDEEASAEDEEYAGEEDTDVYEAEEPEDEELFEEVFEEDPEYVWESSDETVAAVEDGVVTAIKEGKAVITVSSEEAGIRTQWECEITAKDTEEEKEDQEVQQDEDKEASDIPKEAETEDPEDTENTSETSADDKEDADPEDGTSAEDSEDDVKTEDEKKTDEKTADEKESAEDPTAAEPSAEPEKEEPKSLGDANTVVARGYCGDNVEWVLTGDSYAYKLTLSGSGNIYDYGSESSVPWYSYRSEITSLAVGKGITGIGDYAFAYCSSLTSAKLGSTITAIGNYAFRSCSNLAAVTLPASLKTLGNYAFYYCSALKTMTIPGKTTLIGANAFGYCSSLEWIIMSDTVSYIGAGAFRSCTTLTSVILPEGITSIGNDTFEYCTSLTYVAIPDGATYIGSYAFYGCSAMPSISIPNTVNYIGSYAFYNCTSLTEVTIPYGVRYLGSSSLYSCSYVYFTGDSSMWSSLSGSSAVNENCSVYFYSTPKTAISSCSIRLPAKSYLYTTKAIKPSPTVKYNGVKLTRGTDYKVVFKNNVKIGTATVKVLGIGSYTGTYVTTFKITRIPISKVSVTGIKNKLYTGKAIKQYPTLKYKLGGKVRTLKKGTRYTISFSNNINAGTAKIVIKGKGIYTGKRVLKFTIVRRSVAKAKITKVAAKYGYTGKAIKPVPVVKVKIGSTYKTLKKGTDYKVSYVKNIKIGTGAVVIRGIGNYKGKIVKKFTIMRRTALEKLKFSGLKTYTYNGKAKKPRPFIKMLVNGSYMTLRNGTDYTLSYKNNVNAGKASLIITGKGLFKGTYIKKFTINKKAPTLKFGKTSVTKRRYNAGFKVKLTKKTDGTITYSSSKTSVAAVNKTTGKVAIKGVGKTRIYANAAAGRNYKAAKKSYLLTVRKVVVPTLSYSFSNSFDGFDYDSSYDIPLARYKNFFSDTEAQSYYEQDSSYQWAGNCFGMSTTSSLFTVYGSGLSRSSFGSSKYALSDLGVYSYSSALQSDLRSIIESLQVAQRHTTVQSKLNENYDHYTALSKAVKRVRTTGKPVVVCMWGYEGGHAVVGYDVEKISSSTSYLRVYDPNFPLTDRYITLTTDSSGSVTGWSYWMNDAYYWSSDDSYYGGISYLEYATVYDLMKNRRYKTINSVTVNSASFDVVDADGNIVASMNDGQFTASGDDIFEYKGIDRKYDESIIYLPTEAYSIVNREVRDEDLKVKALNIDQAVTVTTEADTVSIEVVDYADKNVVSVEAGEGQSYTIEFVSDIPSSEGIDTFTVSGTGTGEEVTAAIEEGVCLVSDAEAELQINGETVENIEEDSRIEELDPAA